MPTFFLTWGLLVISVIFNVVGVFVIKLKLNEFGAVKVDSLKSIVGYFFVLLKSPLVVTGVFLFFLSPFLFAVALSRMEISVAYPVQVALNFIFLIFLAFFVLGEQMTVYKIVGIVLTIIAVYFLNKT